MDVSSLYIYVLFHPLVVRLRMNNGMAWQWLHVSVSLQGGWLSHALHPTSCSACMGICDFYFLFLKDLYIILAIIYRVFLLVYIFFPCPRQPLFCHFFWEGSLTCWFMIHASSFFLTEKIVFNNGWIPW